MNHAVWQLSRFSVIRGQQQHEAPSLMIRFVVPIALLAIAGCHSQPPSDPSPIGDDRSLRIAAWNIEHLAAVPELGCFPRDEAGYALVADVISRVDADIWLLQEIESDAALARVFDPDSWTFHVENRPDTGRGPACRGREDGNTLRMQRTAIAIRNGIDHVRGEDLQALDTEGRGFLRHGVNITINFRGTPVDLMSVHLKSGCFSGSGASACPTLFDQVPVLESWMDAQGAAGRAVIVGGDFNRRLAVSDDPVWDDLDDGDPVALTLAGQGIGPRCDPRYQEFIDFIVLNEHAAGFKVTGSFAETVFSDGMRASDHCPISITLE